ncbi:MAG: hypothetical protein JJU15_04140 [Pararhodobacter sp.]|nr:hypothetical protein [Pararhodobacter sp.]
MLHPITISLPVADRRRAHDFYRNVLDLQTIGALQADGMPEPLQFLINSGVRLMLVPDDGFGFVVAPRVPELGDQAETLLCIDQPTSADVLALREKWIAADGQIVSEPAQKAWGFTGIFGDPDGHLWMIRAAGE